MLKDFKSVVGPYAALFAGNVPRTCYAKQNNLFKLVDNFCDEHETISQRNRIILSLIARQGDNLSEDHIKTAAEILSDGKANLSKSIETFLKKIQLSKYDWSFNSCILIIDELLDHMFWESLCLNPLQEVCRVSCLFTLSKLYKKYKSSMKNGYLILNIKKGNAVVNADNNLPRTAKRMKLFFDYYLPSWNVVYNTRPTHEQLGEFYKSDCYM